MFVACGIWCLADVSSVSPSSEQTELKLSLQSTYLYRSTFDYLPNVHVRLKSSLFYKMNMGHFLLKPFRQFHRENNFVQIESKFVFFI